MKMKLVVLGATGDIGLEVIKHSIERGHRSRRLCARRRTYARLPIALELLRETCWTQMSWRKSSKVRMPSCPGLVRETRLPNYSRMVQAFGETLTSAMSRASVRRAIAVSAAFLFKDAVIPSSLPLRPAILCAAGCRSNSNGDHSLSGRARSDDRATTAADRLCADEQISGARKASAPFRFRDFPRRRCGFHDQDRREPFVRRQGSRSV